MSRIQPRTLSTQELIRFCADFIQDEDGLPKEWQIELLRRHRDGDTAPEIVEGIHLSINGIAAGLRNSG